MPDRAVETTSQRGAAGVDFDGWVCPLPLRDSPTIVMGHGGGGAMSAELVEHLFLPAFGAAAQGELSDSAVLAAVEGRLAFSADSFVVRPMFFPGGCIGDLAINGTVNDLAMSGARPLYLSTSFILEEGTALSDIGRVANAMGRAATAAGVRLVTGDTKVVDAGHGDGVFVNTAGIGLIADGIDIRPSRAGIDDVIIISGSIGVHGVAIMSVREGLDFGAAIESDCAPLNGLVGSMLATGADIHVLRDPTRGGLGTSLNEIASVSKVGVKIFERDLPISDLVANACSLLGLDPLYVANEGKLVAFVPPGDADRVLAAMRGHDYGRDAAIIGHCVREHPGTVVARTALGSERIIAVPIGEQLPRIC